MTNRSKQAIGQHIKRARTHAGMSQGELAHFIGMRGQSGISIYALLERLAHELES